VFRTFHEISPSTRAGIADAVAEVRAEVWSRSAATTGTEPVLLDIDASLVEIHSENKEQAAPTYKGGFGFSPMFCFSDATGETLAALLRPGNAGANTVADHLSVLDGAIGQLPSDIASGHHLGEDADLVKRRVIVRADSAGCTQGFLSACRARNVGFFVSARSNAQVTAAIFDAIGIEEVWLPALTQDGEKKDGASVCELTSLIDGAKLPSDTRLIVRREPLHPGAQRSLFPSLDFRYWGFYTDQDGDPRDLDVTMRAHAHVEQHICRLKDSGLMRFPLLQLLRQRQLADAGGPVGRPRAVVPAALLGWNLEGRPTQSAALGDLPRSRTSGAPGSAADRRIIDGWPRLRFSSMPINASN
jgi:hypothetical protein